jgi:hypothetical protein
VTRLRSDLWCAAFVRRHNDLGHICVVARKGDPTAGQIWIEVDHLNGTVSLFTPAPNPTISEDTGDRLFEKRFDRVEPATVRQRTVTEIAFDPDIWLLSLELRTGDPAIPIGTSG